jgi:excisionase family DNA binding protein
MSDLLSVKEGAEFTHLEQSTMRSWILQKKIPYVKLGRRVFLRRGDLEALIVASMVPAKVPVSLPVSRTRKARRTRS